VLIQQPPNFDDVSMDMGSLQQNGNNLQTTWHSATKCASSGIKTLYAT